MPVVESDWTEIVKTLGYKSERELLIDLYYTAAMSYSEIARILGFSSFTVRRRLILHGIKPRGRGGLHNAGKRKLRDVPDDILFGKSTDEVAAKYNVHKATVWSERRIRKDGTGSNCSNAAIGDPPRTGGETGAYVPCSISLGELEILGVDESEIEGGEDCYPG